MTENRLPENPDEWPSNPFEVLGIPYDADRNAIRRAYLELIHQYKPERAPEPFRRIREAYDRARQMTQQRLARPDFALASVESMFLVEAEQSHESLTAREIDAAWQLAAAGDAKQAYRRLTELSLSQPLSEAIAARRYWLVRLAPDVDPGLRPVEVLYPLIQEAGMRGVAGQLFLGELARQPEESLADRCGLLLREARNAGWQRPLLGIRWRAAAAKGRWSVIDSDLERIRQCSPLDTTPWLWGHVDALKVCLEVPWPSAQTREAVYSNVLHEHNEWSLETERLALEAEAVERMLTESQSFRDLHRGRFTNSTLPPISWDKLAATLTADWIDPACLRLELEPLLASWAVDPAGGLKEMDTLYQKFPAHAMRLSQLVCELLFEGSTVCPTLSGDDLRQAVLEDLFHERRLRRPALRLRTSEFRRGVLRFCVEERVDLERVALVLHQVMPELPWDCEFHPLRLEADDALQTVIRGCLTLWDEPAAVLS